MSAASEPEAVEPQARSTAAGPRRWVRIMRRAALAILVVVLVAAYLVKDHVRTLQSLHRVPGTNAYTMDYYVDYHIDEIRATGMDVNHVEDSLLAVFFPDWIVPIATMVKGQFIDEEITPLKSDADHCSTVALRTAAGKAFFGRNLDWKHDAHLILKIHDDAGVASVSVIDLHYLNLDRDDLETTNLLQRIPLLFAPYYVADGMNRHGVAVSGMSVEGVRPPYDVSKPNILHSTGMRLILDYANTVDDAVALLKQYNIHFVETTCHLMIADATGESAVVEFIDGEIHVTPSEQNWQVCTNHQLHGKTEAENDQSCDRYRRASNQLAKLSESAGADDVMRIMESASKENWTMWTSVYDLSAREFRIAYRRHYDKLYVDRLGE